VAILWHLHQPDYRDPRTGEYMLPWVRLHALKDYLDMVAHAEAFPEVHLTFNFVPSLVRQLEEYAAGQARDPFVELSARPAEDLTLEEREFILRNFFKAHWPTMVEPYPRYRELLAKRGRILTDALLEEAARRFRPQELRDLQVWFNLVWCGQSLAEGNEVVRELRLKGRQFSEEDKASLLATQQEVLRGLLPRYRRLGEAGCIELSTTPFYHPILPLLCHPEDARVSRPDLPLPAQHTDLPEDAAVQLRRARAEHERVFGHPPRGVWPSEGSISERALELMRETGFTWAASDEQVLALSLRGPAPRSAGERRKLLPPELCRPYAFGAEGTLALFFREHDLSDRIGFVYSRWPAERAVRDLLRRLEQLTAWPQGLRELPIVSIILDGENAWEFYPQNGAEFLRRLYRALSAHPRLQPVTFSEYLAQYPPRTHLSRIHPGSWISHDFHLWMGHPEDNRAWDLLYTARRTLRMTEGSLDPKERARAWEHLYVAEGSDWFWWYGDEHWAAEAALFDRLFRERLQAVYEQLGQTPPAELSRPIKKPPLPLVEEPWALLSPRLDGRITHFFEWRGAGVIESAGAAGTMHRTTLLLERICYGFDYQYLYLALQCRCAMEMLCAEKCGLTLFWRQGSKTYRLRLAELSLPLQAQVPVDLQEGGGWQPHGTAEVVFDRIGEFAVPWEALDLAAGTSFDFFVEVNKAGAVLERWPTQGYFVLTAPDEEWELRHWEV